MKKKKLLFTLALPFFCMSVTMLGGCGSSQPEHHYSAEWSKDETYHWHACTDAGCSEVSDKAEHVWNAGEVTQAATHKVAGVKTYTCTVCHQQKTEAIAILESHLNFKDSYVIDKIYDNIAVVAPTANDYDTNSDGAVTVTWYEGDTLLASAPKNAGSYKVKIDSASTSEYPPLSATKEFKIAKKAYKSLLRTEYYSDTKVYNYSMKTEVTGVYNYVKITLTSSAVGAYRDTGIASIEITGEYKDNYSLDASDVYISVKKDDFREEAYMVEIDSEKYNPTKVYDGLAVEAPTLEDITMNSISKTPYDFVTLDSVKFFNVDDETAPIELAAAPKDVGKYRVDMIFPDNEHQIGGTLSKSFEITPKTIAKLAYSKAYNGSDSLVTNSLTAADGICESDINNVIIYIHSSSANVGTYTGDNITSTKIAYIKVGTSSYVTTKNYVFSDEISLEIKQNTDYFDLLNVTFPYDTFALHFPSDVNDFATWSTDYTFITPVYRTVNIGSIYYTSNDPNHKVSTPAPTKVTGDYNVTVRVPGSENLKEASKSSTMHYYTSDAFGELPSTTVNMTKNTGYCYKVDGDGNLETHKLVVTSGLSTVLGSVNYFDQYGKRFEVTGGSITISADEKIYCVFRPTSNVSNAQVSFIQE